MTTAHNPQEQRSSGNQDILDRGPYQLYELAWDHVAEGNMDSLRDVLDPDFQFTMPDITDVSVTQFMNVVREWRTAFPNLGQNRDNLTEFYNGTDRICVRDRQTLTQAADFKLPDGTVIANKGNTITIYGAHFLRTHKGKILRWDIVFDTGDLVKQLQAR